MWIIHHSVWCIMTSVVPMIEWSLCAKSIHSSSLLYFSCNRYRLADCCCNRVVCHLELRCGAYAPVINFAWMYWRIAVRHLGTFARYSPNVCVHCCYFSAEFLCDPLVGQASVSECKRSVNHVPLASVQNNFFRRSAVYCCHGECLTDG